MTPKEAIEYLNIMKLSTEDDSVGEIKKEVCDIAIEALEKQIPTIDPKDLRPKCTWEQIYEDAWECSNCGTCWTCIEGDPADNDMHFCPVCGGIIEEVVK